MIRESKVYINLTANLIAKIFISLQGILITPFLLRYFGAESYGVVSFYLLISNLFVIFDFGLGSAIQRKLAATPSSLMNSTQVNDLIRSVEVIYWIIGIAISILLMSFSDSIVLNWIKTSELSNSEMNKTLKVMSLALLMMWPISIYQNILLGLQKHVHANSLLVCFTFLRAFGGLWFITSIDGGLSEFFYFQAIIYFLQTITIRYVIKRQVASSESKPKFNYRAIQSIWKFAFGIFSLSFLSVVIINIDKITVLKILPLESYAYYSVASALAFGLYVVISPIYSTFFPRIAELIALEHRETVRSVYQQASKIMSYLIFPMAFFLIFFSKDILLLWTKDVDLVSKALWGFRFLVLGTLANGLMNIPFALQLAHGKTRLSLIQNCISVVVLMPGTFVLTKLYGISGAAMTWLIHNLVCLFVMPPLFHRYFLKGETNQWVLQGCFIPMAVSAFSIGLVKFAHVYFKINFNFLSGLISLFFLYLIPVYFYIVNQKAFSFSIFKKVIERHNI